MRKEEPQILADLASRPRALGMLAASAMGLGLSVAVVSALATGSEQSTSTLVSQAVVSPIEATPLRLEPALELPFVHMARVRTGDTLEAILDRLHTTDDGALKQFMQSSQEASRAFRTLRAGRTVSARVDADGALMGLDVSLSDGSNFVVTRVADGFEGTIQAAAPSSIVKVSKGTITSTLFGAAERAGLPDELAIRLAELFGTEIDFNTDLRKGDHFRVVYEALTEEGRVIGTGRILAAEFSNRGTLFSVVYFSEPNGPSGYFTPDGRNIKKSFLRSPLEFSRVTSGFALRRHPIKNTWRQHQGVDFGARVGTAVKATSDGQVEFVGAMSGYGNTVILAHANGVSTLYAHLSRFPAQLAKGRRVSQGELIGYVGQSGWATGPHLHYEFRKNGVPADPMTIALPSADPLSPVALGRFRQVVAERWSQMALLETSDPIALAD